MRRGVAIILTAAALSALPSVRALAQEPATADSANAYFQGYFNRLVEDWRMEQVRDFARQWGMRAGGREFAINRSFWEDRFNLSLSVGLPRGRPEQNLVLEYQVAPGLLVRGEALRQADRNEAWIDCIFRTEY
ncbi:MAG: hypothetical protein MUF78_06720 [Candidatus Edwardsbacteria bacterium]|jgi:hypothetical protein|nr:hypothetical protein [Candidatus Edwardsbacteria bacterium]